MTTLRVPRTSQPQQPVGIDWSNPLTRGLRVAVNAAGYNIARPSIATDKGKAFSWVRGTPNAIDTGVVNAAVSGHTCLVFARHPSLSALNPEAYLTSTVAGNNGFTFSTDGALGSYPNQTFRLSLTHGGVAQYLSVTNLSGANTSILPLAFSATVSGSVRFFARGLFLDSVATGAINQNSSTLRIGGRPWFSDYYANYDLPGLFYWNRALSDAEIKSLSDNPWQIFAPIRTPIFVGVAAAVSIYRPSSDVTTTGWTGTPDNTDKYKNIDEVTASDTDYITSPSITGGESIIFGLSGSLAAGTWDVRYRANFVGASAQVKIHLLDGSSVSQGASSWQTVTSSYVDYTASVTTTGAATRVKIEVQ